MTAPGLTQRLVADFYEAGARAGRRTEDIQRTEIPSRAGRWDRIETLNGESFQTIVVRQDPGSDDHVQIVLVGSDVRETGSRGAHDARVMAAIETWESASGTD
jgi:hypothetical protein